MRPKKTPTFPQLNTFSQTLVGMGYQQEMGKVRDRQLADFGLYLIELEIVGGIDDNALGAACFAAGIDLEEEDQ